MSDQPISLSGTVSGAACTAPPRLVPPSLAPVSPVSGKVALSKPRVWGTWATMGLGLVLLLAHLMAQSVGVIPFVVFSAIKGQRVDPDALGTNGLVLAVATLIAAPVSVALALLFARIKAGSWREAGAYVGFRAAPFRAYCWSLLTLAGVLMLWMGYARVLNLPDVPQVMLDMYRTAGVPPLFWAAIILAAPMAEEVIFRGFFFTGLRQARLGPVTAIVVPSIVWAAIHLQYGIEEIGFIFLFGLLLGTLRLKSNSLWPPMLVHAVSNLFSTIEVACLTGAGG